jgi:hypothetical protein
MTPDSPSQGRQYPTYEPPTRPDPPTAANLNLAHPKNFLGVPYAIQADGGISANISQSLVRSVGHARLGAEELGLINQELELTPLGNTVASPSIVNVGSPTEALAQLEDLQGSSTRFCHEATNWAPVAQRVYQSYEPARFLLGTLVDVGAIGTTNAISLPDLMSALARANPAYTQAVCLEADAPADTLAALKQGDSEAAGSLPYSGKFRNLKNNLYHVGFLTSSGATTDALQPANDRWAVTPVAAETIAPDAVDTLGTGGDGDAE